MSPIVTSYWLVSLIRDWIWENRPLATNFTYQDIDTVEKYDHRCTSWYSPICHIPYRSWVMHIKAAAPDKWLLAETTFPCKGAHFFLHIMSFTSYVIHIKGGYYMQICCPKWLTATPTIQLPVVGWAICDVIEGMIAELPCGSFLRRLENWSSALQQQLQQRTVRIYLHKITLLVVKQE